MADEKIRIPRKVTTLDDCPIPLREFFDQGDDGAFHLRLDGDEPDDDAKSKLAEFRENNRKLNAKVADLEARLASGDADAKAQNLEAELARTREQLADSRLAAAVDVAFLQANGRPEAREFVLGRARAAGFEVGSDGAITNTSAHSRTAPGSPLTLGEWMAGELIESAFAFAPSHGSGARPSGPPGPRPVVDRSDPLAVGKNLEAIAQGRADVR